MEFGKSHESIFKKYYCAGTSPIGFYANDLVSYVLNFQGFFNLLFDVVEHIHGVQNG